MKARPLVTRADGRNVRSFGCHPRSRTYVHWSMLFQICPLLLCLSGCNSADSDTAAASATPASTSPVAVRTAPVIRADVVPETTLVGTVTAVQRSIVGSPVDGRVSNVYVEVGDLVEMDKTGTGGGQPLGMPIVQLSTETVAIEIAAAKAELTRLENELEELKAGNRPEEIARAKAHWEAARAASDLAGAQFRRVERLNRLNVITAEEFEAAKSAALAAQKNLLATRADYDLMEIGPRREQVAQSVAKVERQKQEMARLDVQRQYHTIRAPFVGYVVQKQTEVGEWLARGAPVAEIVALDPIDIVVHVPESLVNQLRVGDTVPLFVAALPEGQEALRGEIHGISPSADQRARTFPVRIRLRNPVPDGSYLLRDGMQARATVSGFSRSALLIPKDALILGGQNPVVMVANRLDGGATVAVRIEVEPGRARRGMIEVRGDLQAGQQVIVSGNERIQDGQVLRVINEASDTARKSAVSSRPVPREL